MRLAHRRDSKPLLPDFNVCPSRSLLPRSEPPPAWCSPGSSSPAPSVPVRPCYNPPAGSSSAQGLILACPQNNARPRCPLLPVAVQATSSSGSCLLRQTLRSQQSQGPWPGAPAHQPTMFSILCSYRRQQTVVSSLTTRSGHYGHGNTHLR